MSWMMLMSATMNRRMSVIVMVVVGLVEQVGEVVLV